MWSCLFTRNVPSPVSLNTVGIKVQETVSLFAVPSLPFQLTLCTQIDFSLSFILGQHYCASTLWLLGSLSLLLSLSVPVYLSACAASVPPHTQRHTHKQCPVELPAHKVQITGQVHRTPLAEVGLFCCLSQLLYMRDGGHRFRQGLTQHT